jgi:hypothetical protein
MIVDPNHAKEGFNSKIDGLTIAKYKLSQVVNDSDLKEKFPDVVEINLSAMIQIEKQIITLRKKGTTKKTTKSSKHENKHKSTGS